MFNGKKIGEVRKKITKWFDHIFDNEVTVNEILFISLTFTATVFAMTVYVVIRTLIH